MKRSRVLNRPMFNKHNSAYGRGIASNLVTEEQRQRFNAGGRVRLQEGSGYEFGETPIGKAGKTFLHRGLYDPLVAGFDMFGAVPLNTAARMFGYNPGFSGTKLMDIGTGGEYSKYGNLDPDVAYFPPFLKTSAKEGWAHKQKAEEAEAKEKSVWADRLTAKAEIDDPTGEEMETATLDVADWTPKEKEEKKRDVALAMAERLIGGSRDKWGSTAQMKNLAGALGDVRKITDKEDIRKDQRKYRAAYEMYKKLQPKEKDFKAFQGEGLRPQEAMYRAEGISSTAIPKGKGTKAAYKKANVGDVLFDENDNEWRIMTPTGPVTVSVKELIEANRNGTIREMKIKVAEQASAKAADDRQGRG